MSFDPLTAAFDLGKIAIEKIWPDPSRRAEELLKLEELRQHGDMSKLNAHVSLMLGQMDINKIEAGHSSIFVAGARPFILWVCGFAVAYQFVIYPLLFSLFGLLDIVLTIPVLETDNLYSLMLGMLGFGAMRSYEKKNGVARESMGKK